MSETPREWRTLASLTPEEWRTFPSLGSRVEFVTNLFQSNEPGIRGWLRRRLLRAWTRLGRKTVTGQSGWLRHHRMGGDG